MYVATLEAVPLGWVRGARTSVSIVRGVRLGPHRLQSGDSDASIFSRSNDGKSASRVPVFPPIGVGSSEALLGLLESHTTSQVHIFRLSRAVCAGRRGTPVKGGACIGALGGERRSDWKGA